MGSEYLGGSGGLYMKASRVKRHLSRTCKKRGCGERATWMKRTENSWCEGPEVEVGWGVMQARRPTWWRPVSPARGRAAGRETGARRSGRGLGSW